MTKLLFSFTVKSQKEWPKQEHVSWKKPVENSSELFSSWIFHLTSIHQYYSKVVWNSDLGLLFCLFFRVIDVSDVASVKYYVLNLSQVYRCLMPPQLVVRFAFLNITDWDYLMCSVYCWALKQLVISTSRLCCLSLFFSLFIQQFKSRKTEQVGYCIALHSYKKVACSSAYIKATHFFNFFRKVSPLEFGKKVNLSIIKIPLTVSIYSLRLGGTLVLIFRYWIYPW